MRKRFVMLVCFFIGSKILASQQATHSKDVEDSARNLVCGLVNSVSADSLYEDAQGGQSPRNDSLRLNCLLNCCGCFFLSFQGSQDKKVPSKKTTGQGKQTRQSS